MNADRLTIAVVVVGACAATGALIGGSFAGVAGALVGTGVGLVVGIAIQLQRRISGV